ncbi:molybdenum cofactor guanylyltransferase MobA [Sedimentimonas flavescens]|uniref:molybdenum cofactor guanylyltransferase MobA n=1 Tax=Sedimentimonas flavescens TaxID=2851012 RepID=UPI002E2E2B10|nr:molybdenum cofactor guanylyltransferase MobA [Sedimentimonas flavescens]
MIAGLILAGGQGRRMGGADKALLALAGRPLIAHVAARLAPQVGCLAISANGDAARFADLGCPMLPDAPGHRGEGPLAGVLAGLEWAEAQGADLLVTASCDTPFLPDDLVARLVAAGAPAMAASQGRQHPTAALWPVAHRAALTELFASGERRMRVALAGAAEVAFDVRPDPFANINTPDDLVAAEARMRA